MHKTVSASIGSSLFTVEESAYAALDAYLSSIRSHFAGTGDADEIVSDIEARIAEEFSEALGTKRKVVLKDDVDAVIARMGTVADFEKFDGAGETAAPKRASSFRKLRLYRDADDQIIGGVCAGIAKYFDVDPLIVRLAFLATLFAGGFGVVLYAALWILLPEARTTAEKVEMTGGRVTLSAIQDRIEKVMPAGKRNGALAQIVRFPFVAVGAVLRAVGRVLKFLLPIAGRIAGALVAVWAAFAMAFATFVFLALLTNPASPYIGFPLFETVGIAPYVALLVSGYFAVFLPLLLALLVGISLVLLRNVVTLPAGGGIFCAWLLAIVVGAVTVFGVAPKVETAMRETVNETTRAYADLERFDAVFADGIQRINVTEGVEFSVRVVGTERAIARAIPTVEDGALVVREGPSDERQCVILCFDDHATVNVTMPAIERADARDASRISLDGFSGATLELLAGDVARIDAKVSATDMTLKARDAARITLTGTAENLTVSTSGIARIEGIELAARDAAVTADDASRVTIGVSGTLSGTASDAARIEYPAPPAAIDVETTDAARVSPSDDRYDDRYYDEYDGPR